MATSPADVLPPPGPGGVQVPSPYRVVRRRRETPATWTLELEPATPDGAIAAFVPGQFTMLYAFGAGEAAISISGDPARTDRLVHTIRRFGPVTSGLCAARPGAHVGVRGPFGSPWPVAAAEGSDLVIVGGGIGFAPLRPIVHHVLAHRERYGDVVVLYGGRSPDALLYRRELQRWRGRFDIQVHITVDSAPTGWRGRVGLVTDLIAASRFDPGATIAMVCGPEAMMGLAVRVLRERGVPADQIHLSLERHMKCALGHCGRCQLGPVLLCRDGPVFSYDRVAPFLEVRRL